MTDVWTPNLGPGVYDFETGSFIPAPAEQAGAAPAPTMAELAEQGDDFGFGELDGDELDLAALLADTPRGGADEPDQAEAPAAATGDDRQAEAGEDSQSVPEPPVDEAPTADPGPEEAEATVAPDVETVKNAAEHLAMLDALHKHIGDELKRAREDHEPLFADAVNLGGGRTIDLVLPGGEKVGTFNITPPDIHLAWDPAATLAHVERTSPHNVYEVVSDRAVQYPDVIEFVRVMHPELIQREVRPAYLTLLAEGLDDEGCVVAEGGELVKLARRVPVPSDGKGKFGWTRATKGKTSGRDKLVAAWREGKLAGRISLDPPGAAEDLGDQTAQDGTA